MKRAPALVALAACGLWGCGSPLPPVPKVLSIDPNTMTSSDSIPATITVEAVLPYGVDYGTGEITVAPSLLMAIGSADVGSGRYQSDGRLPARVPSRLQPGTYDVTVTLLDDGRFGTLDGGFTVTPGVWPSGGFAVGNIPSPQRVEVPFTLTIIAQGTNASSFNGTVDYIIQDVTAKPVTTGPFVNGVYQESVVIHTQLSMTKITVIDLLGRTATSNTFVVTP